MKTLNEAWTAVNRRFERLLSACYQQAGAEPQARLFEAMNYSLLAGGKRLRPLLTYLFCVACGGSVANADPAALAESVRIYLQENYDKAVDFSALANSLAVSAPYLSRIFREQTGTSPSKYLTGLRMAQAKKLLLDTNLTVREIAVRVGYPDPFHFSRIFRNTAGMSPAQFREARGSASRGKEKETEKPKT